MSFQVTSGDSAWRQTEARDVVAGMRLFIHVDVRLFGCAIVGDADSCIHCSLAIDMMESKGLHLGLVLSNLCERDGFSFLLFYVKIIRIVRFFYGYFFNGLK